MSNRICRLVVVSIALLATLLGCAGGLADEPDAALPADVRADYAVFALRCSKCHSLARPLNSGIDNDEYWKMYVERMRRQPASGISIADTVPILRFLHVYSVAERKRKQAQDEPEEPAPTAAPAPLVPPVPSSAPPPPPDAGPSPATGAR